MYEEIMKELIKADDAKMLPIWQEVQELREGAMKLANCYLKFVRAKLFVEIARLLKEKHDLHNVAFFAADAVQIDEPWRPQDAYLSVGLRVDDIVAASVWTWSEDDRSYFIGYRRVGPDKDARFQDFFVHRHAFAQSAGDAYHYELVEVPPDTDVGGTAVRLADRLAKLHHDIVPLVKEYNATLH